MAKVVFKFNRKEFDRLIDRAVRRGLLAAGKRLVQLTQVALNKPAVRGRGPRGGVVWSNVSRPGEAPRLREGTLRRNIVTQEVAGRRAVRVEWGQNVVYGLYHELGINYRRAGRQKRPHLVPALEESRDDLQRVFSANARALMP